MFNWTLVVILLGASLASPPRPMTQSWASEVVARLPDRCCGTNYPLKDVVEGRSIGGFEVPPHSIPHQVFLNILSDYGPVKCGGSLISDKFVLTAAHCVFNRTDIRVTVGEHNLLDNTDGQEIVSPSEVIIHPNFERSIDSGINNDIAIIKLKEPVKLRQEVGIACLPMDTSETFEGSILVASGWGSTELEGLGISNVLRALRTRVLSNTDDQCYSMIKGSSTEDKLCVFSSAQSGIYSGDSGGPLTAVVDGKATVVGVTSYGNHYTPTASPQVFSRVTNALPWILSSTDAGDWQC